MRDASLANDFATTAEVLLDALSRLNSTDHACCLYPTAPLLRPSDFEKAYTDLIQKTADCIISVTEFDFHPLRAFEIKGDGKLNFKWPENALTRSQDLPDLLHDAGAFYFSTPQLF